MGLDNGFYLKGKTEKGVKFLRERYTYLEKDEFEVDEVYEIAYFRKCFNIRRTTLEVLDKLGYEYDGCGGDISIKIVHMPNVVEDILKPFLNENNWYNGSGSIWEWYVIVPTVAKAIKDIKLFLEDLYADKETFTEDDFEFYFVDSY